MTNQTAPPPTIIRNAAVHYSPYACQYAKHGDLQTDIASGVTCHHCKARLGNEAHSDNPVWRGILAEVEWPHGDVANATTKFTTTGVDYYRGGPASAGGGVFAQAQPDRVSAAQWIDDSDTMQFSYAGDVYIGVAKGWTGKAKTETPSPIRFASIAPRYPGEDTRRAPDGHDYHRCNDMPDVLHWVAYASGDAWSMYKNGVTFVAFYCPYCGGLLPTPQLHEGNAQAPSRLYEQIARAAKDFCREINSTPGVWAANIANAFSVLESFVKELPEDRGRE